MQRGPLREVQAYGVWRISLTAAPRDRFGDLVHYFHEEAASGR